nr:hypothetical protein [uncultured Dongia sp.]
MNKDLATTVHPKRCISPISVSDNTAQVGQVIDRLGYDSLTYLIAAGSLADADALFTVLLEESDLSGSGFTAVADEHLIGTEALASFQFDDDNEPRKLGYIGNKQYSRLTITPSGNASAAVVSAIALLGHPREMPTANPPA